MNLFYEQSAFCLTGRHNYMQAAPFHSCWNESLTLWNSGFHNVSLTCLQHLGQGLEFLQRKWYHLRFELPIYCYTCFVSSAWLNWLALGEYHCSSAKKAGPDSTRPHFEVLIPVHKREIEDNSGKQTSLNQVSVKSILRIIHQSCACNRVTPEAG